MSRGVALYSEGIYETHIISCFDEVMPRVNCWLTLSSKII